MDADDDLRRRLHDADPLRGNGSGVPRQGPRAHEIQERAMRIADQHDPSTTTVPEPLPDADGPRRRGSRWPALVAVAAAAVVAVGAGAALSGVLIDDETGSPASTLALTAAPADAMSSCMMFDVAVLSGMQTALAGTVTSVDGTTATVDVERWYRGGPADVVTVTSDQRGVALDGVGAGGGRGVPADGDRRRGQRLRLQRTRDPRARGGVRRGVRRLSRPRGCG